MYVITVAEAKCKVCGECVSVCPVEVYKIVDKRLVVGPTDDCSYCQSCLSVCAAEAIVITEM
jgi:NAD-dependent dihydropyrimidine dehydrogenase PreA subunit